MIYLLDTDHLSEIVKESIPGRRLDQRLNELDEMEKVATSIVSFEEMMRGWLAEIHATKKARAQVPYYLKLFEVFDSFKRWHVLKWDQETVTVYEQLVKQKLGVKTMDLKIAAITIRNDAKLLSRNLKDFVRVPDLVVEDWLS